MLQKRETIIPAVALTPALQFFLMTGGFAQSRIHGWVFLAQVPAHDFTAFVEAGWTQHRTRLLAEAEAAGFPPWGETGRLPRGPAVRRWSEDFCTRHTY
jgi:hypothetical protein